MQGRGPENPAVQVSCNSAFLDQVWWLGNTPRIGLYTSLQNANSSWCLVIRGTVPGSQGVQTPCNVAHADQAWRLLRD